MTRRVAMRYRLSRKQARPSIMDRKSVNRAIAARVRPLLKAEGFDEFTARSAWRFAGLAINVVNFQSFNSYLASSVGCTTFSFALNLGCHFTFLPSVGAHRIYDRKRPPEDYQ